MPIVAIHSPAIPALSRHPGDFRTWICHARLRHMDRLSSPLHLRERFAMLALQIVMAIIGILTYHSMAAAEVPTPERSNVLLVMTDDQGYGDLGCHGNSDIHTPNLDKLAKESTEFTRFYVSPVCAPTRASLLTGRYRLRTGVWGVTKGREHMSEDETTLAEVFRSAGYATGCFGKWHNGSQFPMDPNGQGFDQFVGFCGGHWNWYFDPKLERNQKMEQHSGYITDLLTDAAMRFIREKKDERFLCYIPYNAPHSPWFVPNKYRKRYLEAGLKETTVSAYAMCENLDENIGRLLKLLDELDLAEETIVIFLTDNGPNGDRYNAGLRARKGSLYEGGCRVPFFIRHPGRIKAGQKIDTMAAHIDVLPTLAELCRVELKTNHPLDGRSLVPLLDSEQAQWPSRYLCEQRSSGKNPKDRNKGVIRTEQYTLVNPKGQAWELYDIQNDRGQTHNLAKAKPQVVADLKQKYNSWWRDVTGNHRAFPVRSIPIGFDAENPVIVHATEATPSGGLKYYGTNGYRHDWITHWTSPADRLVFSLDVARAGEYDMTLNYRVLKEDVGATIIAHANGQKVSGKTAVVSQPAGPILPRSDIRMTNVPVVDWHPLELGSLKLQQGKTQLTLTAEDIPGENAMDLLQVEFKRRPE